MLRVEPGGAGHEDSHAAAQRLMRLAEQRPAGVDAQVPSQPGVDGEQRPEQRHAPATQTAATRSMIRWWSR